MKDSDICDYKLRALHVLLRGEDFSSEPRME